MGNSLEGLLSWCSENGITTLHASLNEYGQIFICQDHDIDSLIGILESNKVSHITYDYLNFDLVDQLRKEQDLRNEEDDFIAEIIKDTFNPYENHNEEICQINIYWTYGAALYMFLCLEDWYIDFQETLKSFLENRNESFELLKAPILPEAFELKLINTIAASDSYFINHTRPNNFDEIVFDALEELGIEEGKYSINLHGIKYHTELVFKRKYKKVKEKELQAKIKALRKEKITKKEIISRLGITEGMYDRYLNG